MNRWLSQNRSVPTYIIARTDFLFNLCIIHTLTILQINRGDDLSNNIATADSLLLLSATDSATQAKTTATASISSWDPGTVYWEHFIESIIHSY